MAPISSLPASIAGGVEGQTATTDEIARTLEGTSALAGLDATAAALAEQLAAATAGEGAER